jgi:MFS family permease
MSNDAEIPPQGEATARRGSLLAIFLTVFIDLLGFGIVLPLLPLYGRHFATENRWSEAQTAWVIALLMASYSAMQFLFSPLWGKLSDRVGRRPILIVGLAGSTICYALFGVAAAMGSVAGLFVSRIGAGIAGATISTAQAYIADTTTKKNRAKGMALIGAAFALGFTLGPVIAAAALFFGGELTFSPWPGYVASALSAVALAVAIFLLPESKAADSEPAARRIFDLAALAFAARIPSLGLLLLCSFIGVVSFASFESTLSLEIAALEPVGRFARWMQSRGYTDPEELKLARVCAVFAYLGVVLTLAQGVLVRRLAGRISEGAMALAGTVLAILGFVLLALAAARAELGVLMVGMAVETIGFAFVNPSLQSLISRRSPADRQGEILGLGQSASSLARILGPVFGIQLFARSTVLPYVAAGALMALCLALVAFAAASGRDYAADRPPKD